MSEMEWLKLTPDDAEYQSRAEYGNRPDFPHGMVHVLRNMQRNESDLSPLPYGHGLYFTTAELAAIPIVKALVEAARKTRTRLEKDYRADAEHRSILSGLGVSEWPTFMPSEWHWLNDALERWDTDGTSG